MPRLIILSDLWGRRKADWLKSYTELLEDVFDIQFYDSCELGAIDLTNYSQQNIHEQFVNGGIDRAVKRLLELERGKISILAFSVGGVIAWNAGLAGLQLDELYAISSTRLRYESETPQSQIKLFFGAKDEYKPNKQWLGKMNLDYTIFEGQGHDLYSIPENILWICAEILKA